MPQVTFILEDNLGERHEFLAHDELPCAQIIQNANSDITLRRKLRGAYIVRLVEMSAIHTKIRSPEAHKNLSDAAKARWARQKRERGTYAKRK